MKQQPTHNHHFPITSTSFSTLLPPWLLHCTLWSRNFPESWAHPKSKTQRSLWDHPLEMASQDSKTTDRATENITMGQHRITMGYQLWDKMILSLKIVFFSVGRTTEFPTLFEPRVLPAPNAPNHRPPTFFPSRWTWQVHPVRPAPAPVLGSDWIQGFHLVI